MCPEFNFRVFKEAACLREIPRIVTVDLLTNPPTQGEETGQTFCRNYLFLLSLKK